MKYNTNEKKRSKRRKHCALAVIRFGHNPPAATNPQTGLITIYCAAS